MGLSVCCHGCERRTSECHATCEEYAEFAKKTEELRIQRYKIRQDLNLTRSVKRDGCEKARRRHKK